MRKQQAIDLVVPHGFSQRQQVLAAAVFFFQFSQMEGQLFRNRGSGLL